MYQRYNSPEQVLSHFSTAEAAHFIFHIFDTEMKQDMEENMFRMWLSKVWDQDYATWKKSVLKGAKRADRVQRKLTDEEAERNIEKANRILNIKEV